MQYLLTGSTGAIGLELVSALLQRGHGVVCLVRDENRAQKLFCAYGIDTEKNGAIKFLRGDITQMCAGVSRESLNKLGIVGLIDAVIHSAGSIKFDEQLRDEIFETNYTGTEHVLDLANLVGSRQFMFVSTAYVAGSASRFTENDVYVHQVFHNPYEESKLKAELLVRGWSNGSFTIFRPSIVVGRSDNGKISSFSGYYGVAFAFWRLRKLLIGRLQASAEDREKLAMQGVQLTSDNKLTLPMPRLYSETAALNIVPVDWVCNAMARIAEEKCNGKTYHLVHPNPPTMQSVFDYSLPELGIVQELSNKLTPFTQGLSRGLYRYQPYIQQYFTFECARTLADLQNIDCGAPPDISREFICRILDYALQHNFGERA